MNLKEMLELLRGEVCPGAGCQRRKVKGESFCGRCYHRLPPAARLALYRKVGEGYEGAFNVALEYLAGLNEVKGAIVFEGRDASKGGLFG